MVSSDLAVMLLPGMPEGAPDAIDARAARMMFAVASHEPVCCAHGARIDVRAKLGLVKIAPDLPWSSEGPILDNEAPSGVFERLAEDSTGTCAALDHTVEGGGVDGSGCSIRARSRAHGLREDEFLPSGCALFPLEVIGNVLVPSPRIPEAELRDAHEGAASLWEQARARFAIRYGESAAAIVDAAARDLRGRKSRGLHLKTLR